MATDHPKAGPNSIPAYQMSGVPYVTASAANEVDTTPIRHDFPFVTRFFQVKNTDADHAMRVGFSANGVSAPETKNYFLLAIRVVVHGFIHSGAYAKVIRGPGFN